MCIYKVKHRLSHDGAQILRNACNLLFDLHIMIYLSAKEMHIFKTPCNLSRRINI